MAARSQLAVVLAEDSFEDLELQYPRLRLEEAGFSVVVAGEEKGRTYEGKHGTTVNAGVTFKEVKPDDVAVLVIPGGYAPDRLRRHPGCLELVKGAAEAGAIIGIICHGAWVGISAGILKGKRLTSFHSVQDDVRNAGAEWVNENCVVDGKLVTAQVPKDLPEFMKQILALSGR